MGKTPVPCHHDHLAFVPAHGNRLGKRLEIPAGRSIILRTVTYFVSGPADFATFRIWTHLEVPKIKELPGISIDESLQPECCRIFR